MRQQNLETKERYNAHVVTVIYTVHKPSTSYSKRARGITVFSHLKSLSFKKTTCVGFSCKLGSAHEWSGAGFELACFRLLVVGNERKRGRAREKNKHDGVSPPLLFLSLAFFLFRSSRQTTESLENMVVLTSYQAVATEATCTQTSKRTNQQVFKSSMAFRFAFNKDGR